VLRETCYGRAVLVEHPLDAPLPDGEAGAAIRIDRLTAEEIADYVSFRSDADPTVIQSRLERGEVCFTARHQGRIVSAAWIATGFVWIDYLGRGVSLAPDEAYLHESFTTPAFRGQSIPVVRARHEAQFFRAAGYRRIVAIIVPENAPALRHAVKSGWRRFGVMGYVKLGPWRRDFCRVGPGERPPGAAAPASGGPSTGG
jgi:GNAT superfamily N-acetyltransferase